MHSEASRPPGARERPAPGDRPRRAVGRLPADRPRRRRGDLRLRGAGALEPPGARPDLARQVHPARRGMRADRQDRRMGAARPRSSEAAHWPDHVRDRGQPVADPVQRPGDRRHRSPQLLKETGVRAERLELEITEGVFLADGDATDETFARLEGARRAARARRFRHRLQLARLFEEGAVRQDQDRPELRPRRRLDDQPQQRDHPRHRHAGRERSAWTRPPRASRPTTTSS